jgi:hypothetical protein
MSLVLSFGEDSVGGGLLPEGPCILQVVEAVVKQKKDDPTRSYISWKFKPVFPVEVENCRPVYFTSSLEKESRWALKDTLEAITGEKFEEDDMELDLRDMIGLTVGANIVHGMYNSKPQANIKDLYFTN